MPERIQRKRTKGWKMPENTVYVGRPTKWGNPYAAFTAHIEVGDDGITGFVVRDAAHAVALFREDGWEYEEDIAELRGKNLACWCPLVDESGNKVPCHADVLLEWANPEGRASE